MVRILSVCLALLATLATVSLWSAPVSADLIPGFRPPSIPIIVLSPTISMWVNADRLTDDYVRHWAGSTMAMSGLVSIDGTSYRFIGPQPTNTNMAALTQSQVIVTPTQTIAIFNDAGIQLNVTFSQSAFPDDLELYARPLAYITVSVTSTDGQKHAVQVYLDHAADVLVNDQGTKVDWSDVSQNLFSHTEAPMAHALRMGTYDQIAFMNRGDGTKNEWGHLYFATNSSRVVTAVQASSDVSRLAFATGKPMPPSDMRRPREAKDAWPASIYVLDYGTVTGDAVTSDYIVFAFDDVQSMFFFHQYQKPYWSHIFKDDVGQLLTAAFADYDKIIARCNQVDAAEVAALTKVGGDEYSTFSALAHRQATGATILVWNEERKQPWGYMKEISSDGDISTVDVIFPAAPFFVKYGPELLRLTLLPVLAYGQNETDIPYRLPWAPHHLGAWPVADIIGEEQEQMPMEESGNMLIMLAAIAQQQNMDVKWLEPYWPALQTWANYLNVSLPDPGEQLCTDDFEGPSPHNVNLALKGTMGLASYSLLLSYNGQNDEAALYMAAAKNYVNDWLAMGVDQSGDHFKLQFNLNNTWSTKYNLMWQYALNIDLFPQSVADNEISWYKSHANKFGVPLDSRGPLLKCDWLSWAAAFATQQSDAEMFYNYIYNFANTSPSRVPFSDFYDSSTNKVIGFQARPVMGGLYARLLTAGAKMNKVATNEPKSIHRHFRSHKA